MNMVLTVRPGPQAAGESTGTLKGYPRNPKRKLVCVALALYWKRPVVFRKSDTTDLNVKTTLAHKIRTPKLMPNFPVFPERKFGLWNVGLRGDQHGNYNWFINTKRNKGITD